MAGATLVEPTASTGESGSLVDYVFDMLLETQEQNYALCRAVSDAIKEIEEKDEKSMASRLMEVMKGRFERISELESMRQLLRGAYEEGHSTGVRNG